MLDAEQEVLLFVVVRSESLARTIDGRLKHKRRSGRMAKRCKRWLRAIHPWTIGPYLSSHRMLVQRYCLGYRSHIGGHGLFRTLPGHGCDEKLKPLFGTQHKCNITWLLCTLHRFGHRHGFRYTTPMQATAPVKRAHTSHQVAIKLGRDRWQKHHI